MANRIVEILNEEWCAPLLTISGSEHLAKNSPKDEEKKPKNDRNSFDLENYCSISEKKEKLYSLLGCELSNGVKEDDVKLMILSETKLVCQVIETPSNEVFKRRLASGLRERGFDAGLCKSHGDTKSKFPCRNYEYVDIIMARTRYIVEVGLAGEFTIARPTNNYQSLLDVFPQIFVGQPKEMKEVVSLMCTAAKESMKRRDMHVPPWRTNGYMEAKWLGSYKRTTNISAASMVSDAGEVLPAKQLVGFEVAQTIFNY